MNEHLTNYLNASSVYTDSNYETVSVINDYSSNDENRAIPLGKALTLKGSGTIAFKDTVDNRTWNDSYSNDTYTVYNLIPEHETTYTATASDGSAINGTLTANGQVMMLYLPTTYNARDIGGWNCDGGTIKYNKIYRGGYINANATDCKILRDVLKVNHELDLRPASQAGNITQSPLGASVIYTRIGLENGYRDVIDLLSQYAATVASWLSTIMQAVVDGETIYAHCSVGADRTGTLMYLVEGLLGVSQADCDRDFEITCLRGTSDMTWHRRNASAWYYMVDYLKTIKGDTLADRIAYWAYQAGGVSYDLMNAFRATMSTGTPKILVQPTDDEPVISSVTNIILTSQAVNSTDIYNNGLGYKNGYYSSSGNESANSADCITGLIPYIINSSAGQPTDVLYIKGYAGDPAASHTRCSLWSTGKSSIAEKNGFLSSAPGWFTVTKLGDDYYKLEPVSGVQHSYNNIGYVRFSFHQSDASGIVITRNEPIESAM